MGIRAPEPLISEHVVSEFCSAEPSLNKWLLVSVLENHSQGISRLFVVCTRDSLKVVGYYALSTVSVLLADVAGKMRRNAPEPIPVIILGRLAVDMAFAGHGPGSDLLADAVKRFFNVAAHVEARSLQVHALNDAAREFYLKWGFTPSPVAPYTLSRPLDLRAI